MSSSDHVEPPVFSPLSTRRNESETSLSDTERVLLVPDPPGAAPHPVECRLVCLDEASGRLIVRLYPTAPWRRIERRLAERTIVMLPAEGYRYLTTGGGLAVRGIVRDLSMTGFGFDSDARVGLGELLVLNITLSDGEVIRIRGQAVRVVRSPNDSRVSWQIGCQFWGVPLADQGRIARLIEAQSPRIEERR